MSIQKLAAAAVLAVTVGAGLGATGLVSARVAAEPPSTKSELPLGASDQDADQAVVANFLASHPMPLESANRSAPGDPSSKSQWHTFLEAVPWSALYGQWGCALKRVDVAPGSTAHSASFGTLVNCGGIESLVGLAGAFATRDEVLATPEGAAARYLYSSAKSRSSQHHPAGTSSPARAAYFVPNG